MKRMIAITLTATLGGCALTGSPTSYVESATAIPFTSSRDAMATAKCLERARSEVWATQIRDGETPGTIEVLSRYDSFVAGVIVVAPAGTGSRGTAYWHGLGEASTRAALDKCGVVTL